MEQPKATRPVKELLQVMLDNTILFNDGLCTWTYRLWLYEYISTIENSILLQYIIDNRPGQYSSIKAFRNRNSIYYWPIYDIKPRIKWIKKHIKLLS